MNIHIFRNTCSDPAWSMRIYAGELTRHLQSDRDINIETISIKGRRWPIIKDVISKDIFYPLYAKLHQGDVNHVIDHSYGSLVYGLDPRKTIVTCHDLISLELSAQASWLGEKRFLYNLHGMLKAAAIIVDSESTKKVFLKHFDFKGNLQVIYPGVQSEFQQIQNSRERFRRKWQLKEEATYLLHVGSGTPAKNIESILHILASMDNCTLIKIGPLTSGQINTISKHKLTQRILHYEVLSVQDLTEFYNLADILVFPSLIEGFGLPVAEAMACGCPVICSNTSSLPEVGGDAAYYIDPHSEQSIKEGIEKVLSDNVLRNDMIRKGLEQASKFKWEETANQVLKIYRQIAVASS